MVKAIGEYLSLLKIPHRRMNTGAFSAEYNGKKRFHRFGSPGMSDYLCWLPPLGRVMALEVKRDDKAQVSEKQKAFLEEIRASGGIGAVVTSVEDVEALLKKYWVLREEERNEGAAS